MNGILHSRFCECNLTSALARVTLHSQNRECTPFYARAFYLSKKPELEKRECKKKLERNGFYECVVITGSDNPCIYLHTQMLDLSLRLTLDTAEAGSSYL